MFDTVTALLPVDVQTGFDDASWGRRGNPDLEANGRRLLDAWRRRGWPIIHIRHDSVVPGSTLAPSHPGNRLRPGFEPLGDEPLVTKSVNSAFIGTDLDLRLRRLGITSLALFGISTDMCVSTTVRMASNLGYRATVIGDACAAFDLPDGAGGIIPAEEVHRVHLATLAYEFARVTTTAEALAALERAQAA